MVICQDGKLINTAKFLLLFHSEILRDMLAAVEAEKTVALFLPFSSESVIKLLTVLATGQAVSDNTEDLVDVNNVAKVIGIAFNGWELGSRVKHSNKNKPNKKSSKQINAGDENVNIKIEPENIIKIETSNNVEKDNIDLDGFDFGPVREGESVKQRKRKLETQKSIDINPDTNALKSVSDDNKKQRKANEKKGYPYCLVCNICGKTFTHPTSLKKHMEQRVCERKLAHKNKLDELMRSAMEKAKSIKSSSIDNKS